MRKRIILFFIISCALIICCGKNGQEVQDEAVISIQTAKTAAAPAERPVRAAGRIASASTVRLSFKIGGVIERLYANEGEAVKAGQLLALLKMDEIDAQVEMAKSGLEKAKRDHQRAKNLFADKVIPLEVLQNAETGLEAAKSQHRIAVFNRDHAVITAPENGSILKRLAEEYEVIGAGHPVYLLGAHGSGWIFKIGIADKYLIQLNPGDSAAIYIDAYPNITIPAKLTRLAAAPDPATGLFEAELALDHTEIRLFDGLIARVNIFPRSGKAGLIIPFQALVNADGSRGFVFTPEKDGTARRREVRILYLLNDEAVILCDDFEITEVITQGALYLADGSRIKKTNHTGNIRISQ